MVQAATLKALEQADLSPVQARGIAQALDIEFDTRRDSLATRSDLLGVESALKAHMQVLEGSLRSEMSELRTELRADMKQLRAEVRGEMHMLATKLTRQLYTALASFAVAILGGMYAMLQLVA